MNSLVTIDPHLPSPIETESVFESNDVTRVNTTLKPGDNSPSPQSDNHDLDKSLKAKEKFIDDVNNLPGSDSDSLSSSPREPEPNNTLLDNQNDNTAIESRISTQYSFVPSPRCSTESVADDTSNHQKIESITSSQTPNPSEEHRRPPRVHFGKQVTFLQMIQEEREREFLNIHQEKLEPESTNPPSLDRSFFHKFFCFPFIRTTSSPVVTRPVPTTNLTIASLLAVDYEDDDEGEEFRFLDPHEMIAEVDQRLSLRKINEREYLRRYGNQDYEFPKKSQENPFNKARKSFMNVFREERVEMKKSRCCIVM